VGLKYVLGQIQANDANLVHGRSPHSDVSTPATLAHLMPPGGVHPIGYGPSLQAPKQAVNLSFG